MASFPVNNDLKIHVGPLKADTTQRELYSYFSFFGKVAHVSMGTRAKKRTGATISKSYCEIQVYDMETYQKILVSDHHFKGRRLECRRFAEGEELYEQNKEGNDRKVIIKNIPSYVTEGQMKEIIGKYGEIRFLFFLNENNPAKRRRITKCKTASVQFTTKAAAADLRAQRIHYIGKTKIKFQEYKHELKKKRSTVVPSQIQEGDEHYRQAQLPNESSKLIHQTDGTSNVSFESIEIVHYLKPTSHLYHARNLSAGTLHYIQQNKCTNSPNVRFNISRQHLNFAIESVRQRN